MMETWIDLLKTLPRRIECAQDEVDTYKAFERWANDYVSSRLPHDQRRWSAPHAFLPVNATRLISEDEAKELADMLGHREPWSVIPMRAALNEIRHLRAWVAELKSQKEQG